jgi:hypothetical protein
MGITCRKNNNEKYIENWKFIQGAYLPAITVCHQTLGLTKIKKLKTEWFRRNWNFNSDRIGSGVLSNNFLTVTGTDQSYCSVYGTFPMIKGNKYTFSVNFETTTGDDTSCVGIANYNHDYLHNYAGQDANSVALWDSGYIWHQTDEYEYFNYFTSGIVDVAVDRINDLIWFRINAGLWNNETSKPVYSSGFDISAIQGTVYPVVFADGGIPTVISVNHIYSI